MPFPNPTSITTRLLGKKKQKTLRLAVTMATKHNIASCGMCCITVVSMRQITFNPRGTAWMVGLACCPSFVFLSSVVEKNNPDWLVSALTPRMFIFWAVSDLLSQGCAVFLAFMFSSFLWFLSASTHLFPLHNHSHSPLVRFFWPEAPKAQKFLTSGWLQLSTLCACAGNSTWLLLQGAISRA